jgi:cell division protein FtsB
MARSRHDACSSDKDIAMKRFPTVIFLVLILALQYPLWFGKGGLLRLHLLENQLAVHQGLNAAQKQKNIAMEAEVRDLAVPSDALEERARADLGMVRQGETWYRYPAKGNHSPNTGSQ